MAAKTERFEMRLEVTMIERVDAWRRKQEDLPSRAEAFRRLIELGLSAKKTGATEVLNSNRIVPPNKPRQLSLSSNEQRANKHLLVKIAGAARFACGAW